MLAAQLGLLQDAWQSADRRVRLAVGAAGTLVLALGLARRRQSRWVPALRPGEVRCCVVTGAAGGIGRATVQKLDGLGWHVLAADFDEKGLRELDAFTTPRVRVALCDVTSPEACERLRDQAEELVRAAGAAGLSGLANVAGLIQHVPSVGVDEAQMRRVLAVNCEAPVRLTRLLMPLLLRSDRPRLCNVASITADVPLPWLGIYSATKGFVANFSETLRAEATANGVKLGVSIVKPGFIDTPMTDTLCELQLAWCDRNPDDPFAPALRRSAVRNTFIWKERHWPGPLGRRLAFLGDPKQPMKNPPEDAAADIVHAICARSPRFYYYTATLAFDAFVLFLQVLPAGLRDIALQIL